MSPMNPRLLRPRASGFDPDAAAYLNAVAVADGQQLEPAVKKAINDFVKGCKQDGIWGAIKASCILAGARTLAGALVPLKGAAPTNNGPFVSGDYNRKTGLVGNATTKYLNTNRSNSADPQNSKHMAVFVNTAHTSAASGSGTYPVYIGGGGGVAGASNIGRFLSNSADFFLRMHQQFVDTNTNAGATGLVGASRGSAASFVFRVSGANSTKLTASQAPVNTNVSVFSDLSSLASGGSNARLNYYSIGESLDLALLDARVSALVAAFGTAIP